MLKESIVHSSNEKSDRFLYLAASQPTSSSTQPAAAAAAPAASLSKVNIINLMFLNVLNIVLDGSGFFLKPF